MEKGKLNISKSNKGKTIVKVLFTDIKGKKKEITVQNAAISEEHSGKDIMFQMESGQITKIVCEEQVLFSAKTQEQPNTNIKQNENELEIEHLEKVQYPAFAPYNFIPLNTTVVEAEEMPDFDRYYNERCTGWIDLEIETKTPLYIRDTLNDEERKKKAEAEKKDEEYDNSDFFSPAGKLRIPGSSLRGMVRTLVEIVSFGKFGYYDNKRLYFRGLADMSNLRKEYQQKMTSFDRQKRRPTYNISSGILKKVGLDYVIIPSGWSQILKEDAKKKVKYLRKNYEALTSYKLNESYLVVSGDMQNNKKRDWIIHFPNKDVPEISIPEEDVENYQNDTTRAKEVNERMNLIECANHQEEAPCFYVKWKDKSGNDRVAFGHTGMFRLAYEKTIGDHIPENLKDVSKTDLAEAIFGKVGKNKEERTIAGRVFFEDAFLIEGQQNVLMDEKNPKILAAPKPTTFQHYLVQTKDDNKQLNHYNSNTAIRGYKLYWHKSGDKWEQTDQKEIDSHPKQYTEIKPVKPETKFSGRIRFENLSKVELGALLFCLDLPNGCYHKLGMGKPIGLGSVKISPKLYLSDRNKRYTELFTEWLNEVSESARIREFKTSFEQYVLGELNGQRESLWNTKRLNELRLMLDYEIGKKLESKGETRYMQIQEKGQNEFKFRPVLPRPSGLIGIKKILIKEQLKGDDSLVESHELDKKKLSFIKAIEIERLWNKYDLIWHPDPEVNILAGINGSGKSTLLKLINHALTDFKELRQEEKIDCNKLKIIFNNNTVKEYFFSDGKLDNLNKEVGFISNLINTIFISTFDMSVSDKEMEKLSQDIITPLDLELKRLINRFFSKEKANDIIDTFFTILNDLFKDTHKRIKSDKSKGLFFQQDDIEIHPHQLSSGEKQIMIILLNILLQVLFYSHQPCIILMDEPEISLHFEWQEYLIDNIKKLNDNTQIIIATHSPGIIVKGWLDKITEMHTIVKK